MSANICGHDRETLRRALEFANSSNLDAVSRDWPRPNDTNGVLLHDVHDPAKLAAIIVELMRERGASVWHGPDERREPWPTDYVLYVIDAGIRVYSPLGPRQWQKQCDMPQARAFALALLDSPAVTAQDIERMIGEL